MYNFILVRIFDEENAPKATPPAASPTALRPMARLLILFAVEYAPREMAPESCACADIPSAISPQLSAFAVAPKATVLFPPAIASHPAATLN